jgi:glycyl-tRNA synthetase beta chain
MGQCAEAPLTVMADTLLVELLTEELPPKALPRLGAAFGTALHAELAQAGLLEPDSAMRWYATPRRLAAQITSVREQAPDKPVEVQGPSVKAGLNTQGEPTPALQGFARKNGVSIEALEQLDTPKGTVFVYRAVAAGAALDTQIAAKVTSALKSLPIPKVMRWGTGDAEFVRPVHGLIMLHGARLIAGNVLDVVSTSSTLGHRFLSSGRVAIEHADDYERTLRDEGCVIASFDARKTAIAEALAQAAGQDAALIADDALLAEVAALTEAPVVYQGRFDPQFLEVPQECLILSMKQHQKYFALLEPGTRALLPRFLVVSNLRTDDPTNIVRGNERVLRARLSDAKFFFDQDRRTPLAERVPELEHVVYHNRLGTQLQRVHRVQRLAGSIARALHADTAHAERAAWLSKADLVTGMVGEFPELQGTMGRYYAINDGESPAVAEAIEMHYRPRHAGDALPESAIACSVAIADKMETLAGLFGIDQQPTGDKDPYALRRQALGVIRILAERDLPLALSTLVRDALSVFGDLVSRDAPEAALLAFFYERMRGYFAESGYSVSEVDAVLALKPDLIHLVPRQLEAVRIFNSLPEAPSLAAANKRIGNILRKAGRVSLQYDAALLTEAAEKTLATHFDAARAEADRLYAARDYTGMLTMLAALKAPVDAFFDSVMVMSEDAKLRDNRIALLAGLRDMMNRVADLSRLAA